MESSPNPNLPAVPISRALRAGGAIALALTGLLLVATTADAVPLPKPSIVLTAAPAPALSVQKIPAAMKRPAPQAHPAPRQLIPPANLPSPLSAPPAPRAPLSLETDLLPLTPPARAPAATKPTS